MGGCLIDSALGLSESGALIFGILLFVVALFITLSKETDEQSKNLAGLFFLIANSFLGFYLLVKFNDFFLLFGYEYREGSNFAIFISALIFPVIIIVSYKLMPNSLVRILLDAEFFSEDSTGYPASRFLANFL